MQTYELVIFSFLDLSSVICWRIHLFNASCEFEKYFSKKV